MKFEENWPRGYRGEVVQRCGRTDDGRTTTIDGRQVITIAHPKPCSSELKLEQRFFPTTFISASENIGLGLKKKTVNF